MRGCQQFFIRVLYLEGTITRRKGISCYNWSMKRIWAPWRMKFINTRMDGCVFCDVLARKNDESNLVIHRGNTAYVMLNLYPYNTGHLLIIANEHRSSLEDLESGCRLEMMDLAAHSLVVIRRVYQPHGFNLGVNIGEAAGAGIPGHIHFHVLPRWTGDASFTLTLAETKILPETLDETYRRISTAWNELLGG